jgi:hypothetical protein
MNGSKQHIVEQPTTNMDICVEDPMATPRERSYKRVSQITVKKVIKVINNVKLLLTNLSFIANITALACSAAFPTIGSKTVLMNATGIFQALEAPCKQIAVSAISKQHYAAAALCKCVC